MKKTVFVSFLALLLLLSVCAAFGVEYAAIDDRADFLTADEEKALAEATSETTAVRYYLLTDTNARDTLHYKDVLKRCGIDKRENAAVLYVHSYGGTYYYDMYTFGRADKGLSDDEIDEILDNPEVYNNLKGGNIKEGADAWIHATEAILAENMDAVLKKEARRVPIGILVCACVFALAGSIAGLSVGLYYRKKVHGEIYPLDRYARLQLTARRDVFIGSSVTRTKVTSSSSGGSSGGGRSSSGGHRGGR